MSRVFRRDSRRALEAPPDREFRAFISYSHADEAWAKWLHGALERYRVPKALVGRTTPNGVVPRRLLPIFRDRDELPGSPSLKHEIGRALERSRALVVICSPKAAVSRYVNEEILTFKRRGRESDIFCMLVDGEPNASDKPESGLLEALPVAIRFRVNAEGALTDERAEPLAADARKGKDARTDAKLKIVSGMLGIGFDELRRREARRQFQQRLQLAAVACAVLLVIGGVWWNRQRALEGQRQIALAQRLIDQSTELLASEDANAIQRGVLLLIHALLRLERQVPDLSANGEAAQARLAADQNLRRALSLFYSPTASLSAAPPPKTYEDNGWASWTAEAVAFGSDGQTVTAASAWGHDPTAAVTRWRVDTGVEDQRFRITLPGERFDWPGVTDNLNPRYFALSPDGDYLATIAERSWLGESSTAFIYHLPGDQPVARVEYKGRLIGVALGPLGEHLAIAAVTETGQPLPLQLRHVPSGRAVGGIPDAASKPAPRALAFSRDGRYLAIAGERITLWELPRPDSESMVRPGPALDLYRGEAVTFSPDGTHVAALGTEATAFSGGEPTTFGRRAVRVWELAHSRALFTIPAVENVAALALSAGATHLAVADDENSLMLHALTNGRATRVHFNPSDPAEGLGSRSSFVNLSGKGPGRRGKLVTVAFSPRGGLMAMAGEVDAQVWRVSSFDEQVVLTLQGKLERVAFDRDERSAITIHRTADPRTIAVRAWDLASGRELPDRAGDRVADAFMLTRTGDIVRATDDARGSGRGGSVIVEGSAPIGPFRYDGDVERILLSPDGQHVAVTSALGMSAPQPVSPGRHQVIVLHLATRAQVLKFEYTTAERDNSVPTAFFIIGNRWYLGVDDAKTIDTGGRRSTFVLWDMKSGEQRPERTDDVMRFWREDIARSGDGRLQALESGDEIRVFTAGEEREVSRIPIALADKDPFRLSSTFVALSAGGHYVAAITGSNRVRVWPVDAALLRSLACSRLTRELSPEEWTAFLPTEDPEPACRR